MARQTRFGRRGVLAAAVGAVAAAVISPDGPPALAASGGGDQGPLILGSNPFYKAQLDTTNTPNTSSVATTVQASPNFSNFTSVSPPTVFQIDARPAGNHEINGIESFATGSGTAVIATASNASTDATGVDASAGGAGVKAQGGSLGVFAIASGTGAGGPPAIGVLGLSLGYGAAFQGNLAPLVLVPANFTGAPSAGVHGAGELVVDAAGDLFFCRAPGSPGTWTRLSTPVAPTLHLLPTPERFVDTRSGLGGLAGPVAGGTTHTFRLSAVNGASGDPGLQIPESATALVGNLTALGGPNISVGAYLTLWPSGPQPTVSNINVGPSDVVANSFLVGTAVTDGHRTINVYNGQECNYLIDITGYYA